MNIKKWMGVFLLLLVGAAAVAEPLILSHRGASYWAPEETKASYELASLLGGDYWEMDIQRTKDGVLIALHDLTLERTTNVAEVFPGREKNPVETFTWAELQKLDAGTWFNKKNPERARTTYQNLKILSFEEVIDLALKTKYGGGLYVESKNPERYSGMEQQMLDLLKKKKWIGKNNQQAHKLFFQSFGQASTLIFQKIAPKIPCTYLIDDDDRVSWLADIKFGADHHFTLGPWFDMYKDAPIKDALVNSKAAVHVWTMDGEDQMQKALELKFDGIFTNRTDLAVQIFRHKPKPDVDGLLKGLGF